MIKKKKEVVIMSRWDRVRTEAGNNYLAVNTIDVNLPVANFIGSVWARLDGLGGATPVTANLMGIRVRAQVIADGSKIIYDDTMRGGQQRVHYKFGVVPELATAGAGGATDMTLPIIFGRYLQDTEWILPAKLYKTLTLRLTFGVVLNANTDLYAATGADLEVNTDVCFDDLNPSTRKILKQTIIESHVNAAAAAVLLVDVPLQGQFLRSAHHMYTTATGAAAAIATDARVMINSGERIAWTGEFAATENFNVDPNTYAPNGVQIIDLDPAGDGRAGVDMRNLGKFQIELTEAAVAGTVVTVCEFLMNPHEV